MVVACSGFRRLDGVAQILFRGGLKQRSAGRPDSSQRGNGQSGSLGGLADKQPGFRGPKALVPLKNTCSSTPDEAVDLLGQVKHCRARIIDHIGLAVTELQRGSSRASLGSRNGGGCQAMKTQTVCDA